MKSPGNIIAYPEYPVVATIGSSWHSMVALASQSVHFPTSTARDMVVARTLRLAGVANVLAFWSLWPTSPLTHKWNRIHRNRQQNLPVPMCSKTKCIQLTALRNRVRLRWNQLHQLTNTRTLGSGLAARQWMQATSATFGNNGRAYDTLACPFCRIKLTLLAKSYTCGTFPKWCCTTDCNIDIASCWR